MDEYISREVIIKELKKEIKACDMKFVEDIWINKGLKIALKDIKAVKAADVQPLSVVTEHIKQRLYETAFNTTEEKARNAIADMAGRIDFWIDELKDGDTNG